MGDIKMEGQGDSFRLLQGYDATGKSVTTEQTSNAQRPTLNAQRSTLNAQLSTLNSQLK
jgi:hypothetical protein